MSLATLFNVPDDEQTLLVFGFSNMDHHRLIASAIATQKNVTLPLFPLDPLPTFNMTAWAQSHQQMHVDFTSALGIAGVDLSDVDFKDPAQLSAWVILHAAEHQQADAILGLSQ
jgi:hypothetical protein